MSILINKSTKVLVQGITGSAGSFHTRQMLEYNTKIVAGVTPGKGGTKFDNRIPIFNTVRQAVEATGADTSVVFVPAAFAKDALLEAADSGAKPPDVSSGDKLRPDDPEGTAVREISKAETHSEHRSGLKLVVCITEGIPTLDMVKVYHYYRDKKVRLVGPNSPGVITPDESKVGIMPGYIHKKGTVGVVSRSGTLTYETVWQITNRGLGQSTCVGIGGDMVLGSSFIDILKLFQRDSETEIIVLIGEIGGTMEEEAADYIKAKVTKPVVSFIAGQTAPKGKRMGHAGAIISGGQGTAQEKIDKLTACGITVVPNPAEIGKTVAEKLRKEKR